MFNWLSNKIIESKVNSSVKGPKKEFLEWNDVRSICILISKDEFYKAKSLNEFIKSSGKEVITVLFIPDKEVNSDSSMISFNKKQTSFIGLPKPEILDKVTSGSYDLMIDCNFKTYNSMKWLAGITKAKFKVGSGGLTYHNYFDICMDLKDKPEFDNYLAQVMNYLKMIRTVK